MTEEKKEDCTTCLYKDGSCYPSYNIYSKEQRCKSYKPIPEEDYCEQLERENNCLAQQLEQAKEIIKEFVSWATWEGANCPNFKDIQSKAEQFLKQE